MRSYKVVMTRRAKDDLIDIGDYIFYTLLEPDTAYHLVKRLRAAVKTLQELPKRYGLIDDSILASQGIYCMPVENYYIFYQVEDAMNTVIVLRIGYNRRNWKEILK